MPLATQDLKTELREAIGAHGIWKQRLRTAVAMEDRSLPVDDICRDDRCRFGQWLKSLPVDMQHGPALRAVIESHRDFHKAAGDVARMVVEGKSAAATSALSTGRFIEASTRLTEDLMRAMREV